ncbi:MAG TPA: four helix bundle protein [Methylomirabilota bacterium]|nr:four helix bundle protein [Methylomirabilota bacterium]
MATITRFEDIEAWQLGRELKQLVYKCSKTGEFARDFALKDQIRRAAMSITANIAEGFERDGNREFIQFLSISKGSCGELQDHLYTALDESYVTQQQFDVLYRRATETARKVGAFMNYLNRTDIRGRKFVPPLNPAPTRNPKLETKNHR